jgi:hypothetical protein
VRRGPVRAGWAPEVGVFAEYFRHDVTDANHVGVGGRLSFNVHSNVALEGELSYDFARAFNETFSDGITTTVQKTDVRLLHGLFGPKFQTGSETARLFFTVKAGFVNFDVTDAPVTGGTVIGTLQDLRDRNTNFALYPGGGVELFAGPIGLRLDAGDQIYWAGGNARHNLRVTFGPHVQF